MVMGLSSSSYKSFVRNNLQILPRQALHARSLAFTHPATGELMFFDSQLPADMVEVIDRWRRFASGSGRFETASPADDQIL